MIVRNSGNCKFRSRYIIIFIYYFITFYYYFNSIFFITVSLFVQIPQHVHIESKQLTHGLHVPNSKKFPRDIKSLHFRNFLKKHQVSTNQTSDCTFFIGRSSCNDTTRLRRSSLIVYFWIVPDNLVCRRVRCASPLTNT